jgi:DNA-binding transcriptional regulator YhcF (GntR family)
VIGGLNVNGAFKVRDNLEFQFCRVDLAALIDEALSIYDSHVYAALCSFASVSGESFPSVKTLAQRAKCSERQARASLRILEEQGYITTISRPGGVNIYTLTRSKRVQSTPAQCAGGTAHHAGAAQNAGEGGTECRSIYKEYLTRTNEQEKDTLTGKPEAPSVTPIENNEPAEEDLMTLDDVPASMKECVDYFLLKTGRHGICSDELSAVRALEEIHTPQRVNREIATAIERYGKRNTALSKLTLTYIYESLKFQTSRKTTNSNAPQEQKKKDPYEGCYL